METMLFDIPLSKQDNLLRRFEEIHDYIYANDGLSPQQALEEFIKFLFVKIFDENNNLNLFSEQNITELFEKTKKDFPEIFEIDEKIRLSESAVHFITNKLQNISLVDSSQDAKGLAFQKFLSHHEKERQGQFFTPEPVIDFCVEMMQPKPNEKIIDPACGSGGFLMSALKYLQKKNQNIKFQNVVSENVFGFDINKSILRIAKMKLLLEANVKTNVFCLNSLENFETLNNAFDLVLANPPFGAKITDSELFSKFDLGYKWAKRENEFCKTKTLQTTQNAEILFIERCLKLLKEGGRMGIVLPNGNFENPSLEYLRFYIKQKSKLLAVIKLPQETFIPYGTGVKTSILFLEKDTQNIEKEYPVFFGKVTKLGYQGNKNGTPVYKKDSYGQILKINNRAVLDENFSEVAEQYRLFQQTGVATANNSFSINYKELKGRFDFDFYSPENKVFAKVLKNGKTVRLGELCDIVKFKSPKLKNVKQTVEYVELSDINTLSFEIINSTTYSVHELPSRASYELKEGDIITAIAGNSVGTKKHATAFVSKEYEGCICTNGFRVLRNCKIDPYYLLYYLHTEEFLKQMFMYRTGAAIPNVSDIDLANIKIYIPFNGEKEIISNQIKKAFELKQEFKNQLENIVFKVV
ncbi:MAG: N-6 DNA methylase [Helicobacteraceae bacterium]|jgi:type I restriction enzyme M protein|nr:N-6 DNA methylase [Helicobacteraceae bacterium]